MELDQDEMQAVVLLQPQLRDEKIEPTFAQELTRGLECLRLGRLIPI